MDSTLLNRHLSCLRPHRTVCFPAQVGRPVIPAGLLAVCPAGSYVKVSPRSGQCTCRTWGSGSLAPFFPGRLPSLSSHHGCPGPCLLSAGSQAGRMAGFPWETRPAFKTAAGSTGECAQCHDLPPSADLGWLTAPGQGGHRQGLVKELHLTIRTEEGAHELRKAIVPESLLRPPRGHYCQLGNLSQLPTQVARRKQNAGVPGGVPQVSDPHTACSACSPHQSGRGSVEG